MRIIQVLLISLSATSCCLAYANSSNSAKIPKNNPCAQDIQKYCAGKPLAGGKLVNCMKDHAAELSSSCKSFGENYKKKHPEITKQFEKKSNHSGS